jgi:hypothetical protein
LDFLFAVPADRRETSHPPVAALRRRKNPLRRSLLGSMKEDAPDRSDANSTCKEDSHPGRIVVQIQIATGSGDFEFGIQGRFCQLALKAVSRIRVATMRASSYGALAIENSRTLPSASVSTGLSSVMSIHCPGLKAKFAGFSNWKAMVRPAAEKRLFSFNKWIVGSLFIFFLSIDLTSFRVC